MMCAYLLPLQIQAETSDDIIFAFGKNNTKAFWLAI